MFERKSFQHHYEGAMKPFRIIGNVFFVGCFPASSHLIDTGDGLLLIDTGYSDTLFLLINSIYELGYRPCDIKYILHTHWHSDHAEATAALVHLTGAKTLIGAADAAKATEFFTPDILLKDGDTVSLGNTTIEIMETPGHTQGCISLFFNTEDNGQVYRVGMFGGAGSNTLVPGHYDYPNCVKDYLDSVDRLNREHVDVFIGNHVWNNDTLNKSILLQTAQENPFIDRAIWHQFLDFCRSRALQVSKQNESSV